MGSPQTPLALVRFGVFEADLRAGELRRNGIKVRLQDLPFRALTLLLTRSGEVITREEFRQALWAPDVFVDFEQGISSAVMRLRDALGDSADNPIFIETIERRGYRWIGPIHLPEPVSDETQEKELPEKPATPAAPPLLAEPSPWQWKKMVFALPVLAMLFALWIFRPGIRDAKGNPKSVSATAQGEHQPVNREAEELYLKGRFYWNKRTPESLNQALEAFTQAIAHDPNYSDAYVGLADSYNLLREFSAIPGNEAYFKAFAAAKKAVELDQQSSEAHASLAFVTFFGMWDAAGAEKEFRRAIQLDPNNVKAHHWFATFLNTLNRHDEALTEIDLARKLTPDSSSILADKGVLLWDAGHREAALQLLRQLETAEPDFVSTHRYLRVAYLDTGDYPNYIAELKKDALLTHNDAQSAVAEAAAKGFVQGGERGLFRAELSEQMKLYEQGKLSPYFLAQTDARLGNTREALRYLTICVQSHDEQMLNLPNDQSFASLRGDAAFEQLLAKAGLPASTEPPGKTEPRTTAADGMAPISSIAVLPFDNLSAPAFNDAFSDGLTDEIAASISHLDGVRVAGRRSAYVFKGKHDDLRDIGSRLNVEAVVEGSVQRAADRTHVTVELNRTRDGFTIWSQTYDGTTADWIQIESQIAGSIAQALARKISPRDSPATHDPEAHALYLEARYLWNQRNFPAELKSVDLLQQAIARDPNYALAWAGLADSLIAIGDVEEVDPAAYLPRARDAALKALQLDPSLAEPHAALGMVACHYDYDWPTAEREYKKAFELNPNYASAHQYYALGLMAHGRFAEAEAQLDIARRLDPLAFIVDVDLALLRKFQRDFNGVIAVSKSILDRDPNYHLAYSMLAAGYFCERRWDDWRAVDTKIHQDDFLSAMANGHPDEIERTFRKLTDDAKAGTRRPYDVGHYAVLKGDRSTAIEWLEKSYQHHDYWMLFINVDPEYDAIRSDPRFQAIVHRLGVG